MDHMRCRSKRQPGACRAWAENQEIKTAIVRQVTLKAIDDRLTLVYRCLTVDQINSFEAKLVSRQFQKTILHLTLLDEHQGPLTTAGDMPEHLESGIGPRRRGDKFVIRLKA
jgi:hypothetical protein